MVNCHVTGVVVAEKTNGIAFLATTAPRLSGCPFASINVRRFETIIHRLRGLGDLLHSIGGEDASAAIIASRLVGVMATASHAYVYAWIGFNKIVDNNSLRLTAGVKKFASDLTAVAMFFRRMVEDYQVSVLRALAHLGARLDAAAAIVVEEAGRRRMSLLYASRGSVCISYGGSVALVSTASGEGEANCYSSVLVRLTATRPIRVSIWSLDEARRRL